jgi:hypothetical protein
MSLLIALAAAAALGGSGPAPATPTSSPDDAAARAARLAELPATDQDIEVGLWRALEANPERVVCSIRTHTGSRQARTSCATLKNWFANRLPREIQKGDAPWQLVEEIKDQRKKAMARR